MSADSPLTVTLNRDPWWSVAVVVWALLALASSLSWWLAMRRAPLASGWLLAVPLAAAAHAAWLVVRECRRDPVVLGWNGLAWSVDDGSQVRSGEARIAIDLDRWVLLRVSSVWIPASAGSLPPGRWHALRCALVRHAPQAPSYSATVAEIAA